MSNKTVAFVIPALEVDATWDPVRRAPYIGIWSMASLLKEKGYEAYYLDESMRDGSWDNRTLYQCQIIDGVRNEIPLNIGWDEYQKIKMIDYHNMDSVAFTKKYSAFNKDGSIDRVMSRIGKSTEQTLAYLSDIHPNVVAIPLVASANYLSATRLGKCIKDSFPKIKIVFGGQHITADPVRFVKDNPWVDYVADGDAITTIQNMVEGNYDTKTVYGGFQQMNSYPLLDYGIIKNAGYPVVPTHTFSSGLRSVEWMASRGCYRNCEFCFAGRKEEQVTQYGWTMMEKQLDHFVNEGIQEIVYQDDAWLYQAKERFPKLLRLMKDRGLSFQNNGGVEFESFDDSVSDMLIAYNDQRPGTCTSLYIPFNPRGWNSKLTAAGSMIHKWPQNVENLKRARLAGIYVFTSLIIGTPDQSKDSYDEDLAILYDLIQDGYLDAALPLSATMLPGTEWYSRNSHNIVSLEDWPGYSLFTTHHSTEYMSAQEIEERMVRTLKVLGNIQKVGSWQTAFPNFQILDCKK